MENVHRNLESFDAVARNPQEERKFYNVLEGCAFQEKSFHQLRKGTARLAFGAEEKYGLDVHIVPVDRLHYPSRFRKEVMINFHEAFSIKELKEIYDKHPARALNILTRNAGIAF